MSDDPTPGSLFGLTPLAARLTRPPADLVSAMRELALAQMDASLAVMEMSSAITDEDRAKAQLRAKDAFERANQVFRTLL